MDLVLRNVPGLFLEYASWDSIVTTCYLTSLYGLNTVSSTTLPSERHAC